MTAPFLVPIPVPFPSRKSFPFNLWVDHTPVAIIVGCDDIKALPASGFRILLRGACHLEGWAESEIEKRARQHD